MEAALTATPVALRPCHNDMMPANFIDAGGSLRLIDYEYAANNDPCFDLGGIWSEAGMAPEQLDRMVREYHGEPRPDQVARARLWAIVCDYGWMLWAAIQAGQGVGAEGWDPWQWGCEHFARAVAAFESPEFDTLLARYERARRCSGHRSRGVGLGRLQAPRGGRVRRRLPRAGGLGRRIRLPGRVARMGARGDEALAPESECARLSTRTIPARPRNRTSTRSCTTRSVGRRSTTGRSGCASRRRISACGRSTASPRIGPSRTRTSRPTTTSCKGRWASRASRETRPIHPTTCRCPRSRSGRSAGSRPKG